MYEDYFGFTGLPFSITPDRHFFYDNTLYREAFATLRYGIEARKGFIVMTGEIGTGKTTLVKVFLHSAEPTIHTALIFNPKLSFIDLLRAILNDLGVAHSPEEDRFTLLGKLNDYLIEQFKKRHVVALLVDEAQNLDIELLEELRLLSNLETNKDKLLQIVLIGQPELEQKLAQPELSQLKQRVALRCRLGPLQDHEIDPYIHFRLKRVGYEGKPLFDAKAIEKITRYSKAVPRLINVICDNALLIAYAASKKKVSADMIEEVARDLQLITPLPNEGRPPQADFKPSKDRDDILNELRTKEGTSTWVSRKPPSESPEFFLEKRPSVREGRRNRKLAGLGVGMFVGILVGVGIGGAIFYFRTSHDYRPDLPSRIENRADQSRDRDNLKQAKLIPDALKEDSSNQLPDMQLPAPSNQLSDMQLPAPNEPVLEAENLKDQSPEQRIVPAPEMTRPLESPAGKNTVIPTVRGAVKTARNDKEKAKSRDKRPVDSQVTGDPTPTNERLEFEIYKAIYNRAIRGVEVSVVDGVAYLDGRVASERQKLAAGQAARSVAGVRAVRDRIVVNYGVAPRYTDVRPTPPRF
jgi:general secretion pathway protein A